MKLVVKLRGIVLALLAVAFVSALFVFFQVGRMAEDGNVVNHTGKQRAISQRLTKMILAKHEGIYDGAQIQELTRTFDRLVNGLVNGDAEWHLPKATDAAFLAKMSEMKNAWEEFKDTVARAERDPAVFKELFEDSENLLRLADESATLAASAAEDKVEIVRRYQIAFFILNIIVLASIWVNSKRKIAAPLEHLTERVQNVANGNLMVDIVYESKDEVGDLSRNMHKMIQSFTVMINGILSSANNVVGAVDILRARAERTASGARSQSGQAARIATATEEMSQTITDIARNASVASETSSQAMAVARGGQQISSSAVETVNRVHSSTVELATMVEKLNNRTAEIGDIVTVIKDIADQTNLLALNAAIEAARAGEQGRGFAVVADEVRKLAERTIKATGEISGKIGTVQADSEQTSKSMTEAAEEVTRATRLIRNVGDSLLSIVEEVQRVRDQITQIATAVDQQSSASEEVVRNVGKTSDIAQDMERMADDVMHEVNVLTGIAEELRNSTAGFRTKDSEMMILDLSKTDHRLFVNKIEACLRGERTLDVSRLPDHHTCRFGRWYDTEGKEKCGTSASYRAINAPHERVHIIAKEALIAHYAGDHARAERLHKEMEDLSDQIVSLLDGIKRECR